MKECKLKWYNQKNGEVVCLTCGRIKLVPPESDLERVHFICKPRHHGEKKDITPPPIFTRISNFAKATVEQISEGNPKCTQEEIDRRYKICSSCPLFIAGSEPETGVCSHTSCGCNLNRKQIFLNKLAWGSQQCPIGRWGKGNE